MICHFLFTFFRGIVRQQVPYCIYRIPCMDWHLHQGVLALVLALAYALYFNNKYTVYVRNGISISESLSLRVSSMHKQFKQAGTFLQVN